jgi:hypothetical protein
MSYKMILFIEKIHHFVKGNNLIYNFYGGMMMSFVEIKHVLFKYYSVFDKNCNLILEINSFKK